MGTTIDSVFGTNMSGTGGTSIKNADPTQLQNEIDKANAQSQNYYNTGSNLQNSANSYTNQAGQSINNTNAAITNANNVAQGGDVSNSLSNLQGQANGTAPTAATGVMQQGTDQAIQTQQAMANSGNTSQMISGQKNAMNNAAGIQETNANQAGQIAANQQMQGSQAYANAAAQQSAQVANNVDMQQKQSALYSGLGNQQNQAALGYGGLSNQSMNSALTGQNSIYTTQQGANNMQGQVNAGVAGGTTNAIGGVISSISDYYSKDNIQYASGDDSGSRFSLSPGSDASVSPSNLAIGGVDKPVSQQERSDDQKQVMSDAQKSKALSNQMSHAYQTDYTKLSTGVPPSPVYSDKRGKIGISHIDKIKSFLDALDPVTFEYKQSDGVMGRTPGKHMGVIAQQVEKAPGGASMIMNTPQGKVIDISSAVGTLLASAAELNDRLSEIEEHFRSKSKKGSK